MFSRYNIWAETKVILTQYLLKLKVILRWVIIFLVITLLAALLGFSGLAAGAASMAKIVFYIFIVLLAVSLIAGLARGWR